MDKTYAIRLQIWEVIQKTTFHLYNPHPVVDEDILTLNINAKETNSSTPP